MRLLKIALGLLIITGSVAQAAWPDAPWVNGAPRGDAAISAVAFVSPMELQFSRITAVWKRLEKKYAPYDVNFLIVAMKESALPFNDKNMFAFAKEENYALPIYLDFNASYSKLWRAYVSPTINLVLRNGKVTGFDPGSFDPALFEKTLQKTLRESGLLNLPPRDFANDAETKTCGQSHTYFAGTRYEKAWAIRALKTQGPWQKEEFSLVSPGETLVSFDLTVDRTQVGIIAETARIGGARLNVTLEGDKLSPEIRGRDVQEDKNGHSFVTVKSARLYEVLHHASKLKETTQKLTLSTEAKGLRIWAVETVPTCQE